MDAPGFDPGPLGSFIRTRRDELDLSTRRLAQITGVSRSHIVNLERGMDYASGRATSPTVEMLQKLAAGLKVDPADLFIRALGHEPAAPQGSTARLAHLWQAIASLPTDDQDTLRTIAEGLAAKKREAAQGAQGEVRQAGG